MKNKPGQAAEDKKKSDKALEAEMMQGYDKHKPDTKITKLPVTNKIVLKAVLEGEDGDAYLLTKLLIDRYAYDHATKDWYYWNDNFWRLDKKDHVVKMVIELIDLYNDQKFFEVFSRDQASKDGDAKAEKQHEYNAKILSRRIAELRNLKKKRIVLQLAASGVNSLGITGENWDKHPMLLACNNTVIDLREGKSSSGKPDNYLKTHSPIIWDDINKPAPRWKKFISEMFSNDKKVVDYIQRLLGYGITGLNTENIFPILWGQAGRNGKSTLFEILKYVLGDFAYKAPSNFLMEQGIKGQGNAPDSVIMGLFGKRIVWCSETNEQDRVDVAKLKELVGGDTLAARLPYAKRQVEFVTTHLLLTITNSRPKVPANDQALWRRIHLIPLKNTFIDEPDSSKKNEFKADKDLLATLKEEAPGILAWLVRGCLYYQEWGLLPPASINDATAEYRINEDIINDFIDECCTTDDNISLRVEPKRLYKNYKEWCDEVGHRAMSKKRFLDDIRSKFESVKIQGFHYFIRIGFSL